jgi:hypothetical protein
MMTVCFLVGLGLAICGVIIACVTARGRKSENVNSPPPLPPRVNVGMPSSLVSQTNPRISNNLIPTALPPRHSSTLATVNANRKTVEIGYGPRGIKPFQFPCCPFDKQRNVPGERQVIFWDNGASCYRCSRGHQFKSNGKLL